MIRVAESQLSTLITQSGSNNMPESKCVSVAGDVNHAWLEMLNHATTKVVHMQCMCAV